MRSTFRKSITVIALVILKNLYLHLVCFYCFHEYLKYKYYFTFY